MKNTNRKSTLGLIALSAALAMPMAYAQSQTEEAAQPQTEQPTPTESATPTDSAQGAATQPTEQATGAASVPRSQRVMAARPSLSRVADRAMVTSSFAWPGKQAPADPTMSPSGTPTSAMMRMSSLPLAPSGFMRMPVTSVFAEGHGVTDTEYGLLPAGSSVRRMNSMAKRPSCSTETSSSWCL